MAAIRVRLTLLMQSAAGMATISAHGLSMQNERGRSRSRVDDALWHSIMYKRSIELVGFAAERWHRNEVGESQTCGWCEGT